MNSSIEVGIPSYFEYFLQLFSLQSGIDGFLFVSVASSNLATFWSFALYLCDELFVVPCISDVLHIVSMTFANLLWLLLQHFLAFLDL